MREYNLNVSPRGSRRGHQFSNLYVTFEVKTRDEMKIVRLQLSECIDCNFGCV